jgi:hypothetical protein
MKGNNLVSEVQLSRIYSGHGNDQLKEKLLAFWSRHPNREFLASTISCALDYRKCEVKKALEELVKTGLIDTYLQSGFTLYKLHQG